MAQTVAVRERGQRVVYSFDDLMLYHGGRSPAGVAHAFKVMERAFALIDPDACPKRRAIEIRTAFGGPGARDAFEMVTRAVTGDRYTVDAALTRPELGRARERFVFEVGCAGRTATLRLREGFVTGEFVDLARTEPRTPDQERRLDAMKDDMARRVMAAAAADVYDAG
jgi:hypothetical protein